MFDQQKIVTDYIMQFIKNINADNKYLTLNFHRNDNNYVVYVDVNLYGLFGFSQKYQSEYKSLIQQLNKILIDQKLDKYFTLLIRSENSFSLALNNNISQDSFKILLDLIKLQKS